MVKKVKFKNLNKNDLCNLAKTLGNFLKMGDSIFLNGPVGVGKTFFIRCLIEELLPENAMKNLVTSPTFNLVKVYDELNIPIWHVDLYRLESSTELVEIGLDQAFHEAICLIEWPDILGISTAQKAISLSIEFSKAGQNKRDLNFIIPKGNFNKKEFHIDFLNL